MEYLVTSSEMRAYDTYTIEHMGIPSLVLMERAALSVVDKIKERWQTSARNENCLSAARKLRVLCVCGTGNNGGDGLCVARLLREQDIFADAFIVGNRDKMTRETQLQLSVFEKYGANILSEVVWEKYDIIVDALLGIGLSREVSGDYKTAIENINNSDAYIISVDIPSGIDSDNGKVLGCAVKADETIAMAYKKRGHCFFPGSTYCGKITVASIGITDQSFAAKTPQMYTFCNKPQSYLPKRRADGNKGTFGKVLLVAGSGQMAGAALLCAESAYKMGSGMVKLVIPEAIREIVQTRLPEALIQSYASSKGIQYDEACMFDSNTEWADVIAVGPGLGVSESSLALLKRAIDAKKPLVIDADGLNLLASDANGDLWESIKKRAFPTVLTPHMGELAKLLGISTKDVVTDETKATLSLVKKSNCIVVAKSARTHVCADENTIFLNTAGNDKMATAGSGDLLTGILASLLGQGLDAFEAATLSVYFHACAGDMAAKEAGCAGILASDMINAISFLEGNE